ncbi:MAG: cupin domain-containing protein [Maribacter sp.]
MEVIHKPQLTHLQIGNSFKTMQVTGQAGTSMPPHHSTGEAIIIVQEGQALLKMPDAEHVLEKGSCFIIPAGKEHSLKIVTDFKAVAVMAVDSEINFI